MKAQLKELLLVLAIATGLFGVVMGLAAVMQPQVPPAPMPELPDSVGAATPVPSLAGAAKEGASLYARNCIHCHGDDAKGDEGPSLFDLTRTDARITEIIRDGIKGEMPKFAAKFSDEEIKSLIAFLRTLRS